MKTRYLFGIFLFLTAAASLPATAQTEYLAVFLDGKKVGHAVQTRLESDGKVTTSENVNISLSRSGIPVTVDMTETSIETADGKPLGFMSVQNISMMVMKIVGTVDDRGMVNLTSTSMGAEQKETMPWPEGAIMAEGLRILTLKKGLKEGAAYSARIFSPGLMQAVDAQIKIGPKQNVDLLGRVVPLTEVAINMNVPGSGEIPNILYVDEDFRAQKSIVNVAGMQMEMIACTKEFALGQNDVFEVFNKMFLSSPQPLENLANTKAISYHLTPTSQTAEMIFPSTDNQQAKKLPDGSVIVVVRPLAAPSGAKFPYRGRDKTILEATQPTRFLQSDNEEVIKLGRLAVGDTKDAAQAVAKIEAFVADYVQNKNLSIGYASAAEVAASRQGDCSEFAVLTAAMCRSLGIPAQVVMGIAYVDDFVSLQTGFGGHAWVRAYVGDKWVGLDAAFKSSGRGGYDAGHIAEAVGNGNPEDFFALIGTIGQYKIDKIIVAND